MGRTLRMQRTADKSRRSLYKMVPQVGVPQVGARQRLLLNYDKVAYAPGVFSPRGVFFFLEKIAPLPLRTPRGDLFPQKISYAPGGYHRRGLR